MVWKNNIIINNNKISMNFGNGKCKRLTTEKVKKKTEGCSWDEENIDPNGTTREILKLPVSSNETTHNHWSKSNRERDS